MVVAHETQARIGRYVITPAATIALLAGVNLATDAKLWGETWVMISFVILVAILGLGGAVLAPTERRWPSWPQGVSTRPSTTPRFARR